MLPEIEKLLVLQDRDQKLRELRRQRENLPRELALLDRRLEERKQTLLDLKQTAQHTESERKNLDLDVQAHQQKIGKYKLQQSQTKKNEEYSALMHEIERAEKEIVALEDRELELMERVEAAQKAVKEEAARVAEFEKGVNSQREQIQQKLGAVEKQVGVIETERAGLGAGIEPVLMGRYERLLKNKGDAAVVPIVHGNTCGGCHMTLTSQTIIDTKTAKAVISCENCGRLLYFGDLL